MTCTANAEIYSSTASLGHRCLAAPRWSLDATLLVSPEPHVSRRGQRRDRPPHHMSRCDARHPAKSSSWALCPGSCGASALHSVSISAPARRCARHRPVWSLSDSLCAASPSLRTRLPGGSSSRVTCSRAMGRSRPGCTCASRCASHAQSNSITTLHGMLFATPAVLAAVLLPHRPRVPKVLHWHNATFVWHPDSARPFRSPPRRVPALPTQLRPYMSMLSDDLYLIAT